MGLVSRVSKISPYYGLHMGLWRGTWTCVNARGVEIAPGKKMTTALSIGDGGDVSHVSRFHSDMTHEILASRSPPTTRPSMSVKDMWNSVKNAEGGFYTTMPESDAFVGPGCLFGPARFPGGGVALEVGLRSGDSRLRCLAVSTPAADVPTLSSIVLV